MSCLAKKLISLAGVLSLVVFMGATEKANAATFDIFEAGTIVQLGSFNAPAAGGTVTSMTVNVSGFSFDVLGLGMQAPVYNLATNDLGGTASSMGAIFNSAASGICGIGECAFSFFSIYDDTIPGEWYVDKVFPLGDQQSISFGFYEIQVSAVPLPAALPLFGAALLGMAYLGRRRKLKATQGA